MYKMIVSHEMSITQALVGVLQFFSYKLSHVLEVALVET